MSYFLRPKAQRSYVFLLGAFPDSYRDDGYQDNVRYIFCGRYSLTVDSYNRYCFKRVTVNDYRNNGHKRMPLPSLALSASQQFGATIVLPTKK
jgi:hypothetical protein